MVFQIETELFQIERDDAKDGAVAHRCVLKGFFFKFTNFLSRNPIGIFGFKSQLINMRKSLYELFV